ncbi:MAG: hypothetical protein MUE85_14245 [Microscillaceae bacterium]|nr:hypothetical protein [Microscillaceae bacterium]
MSLPPNFADFISDWKQAKISNLEAGKLLIVVPITRKIEVRYFQYGFLRRLSITLNAQKQIIDGHIVELLGKPAFIRDQAEALFQKNFQNFSGGYIEYDLAYNYLSGSYYQAGVWQSPLALIPHIVESEKSDSQKDNGPSRTITYIPSPTIQGTFGGTGGGAEYDNPDQAVPVYAITGLGGQGSSDDTGVNLTDPDTLRKEQLAYIATHNGQEGRDFKTYIESLIANPEITVGEVQDINEIVNNYYLELKGLYMMAVYLPVAEAAQPFIELGLIETGSGVLFQSVKSLLSVKWSIDLTKIGINTASISTITSRVQNALRFSADNKSLNLVLNGRNITGVADSKSVFVYNGVSANEAQAIFNELTTGRIIKNAVSPNGYKVQNLLWINSNNKRQSISFRRGSTTNQGEVTIEIQMAEYENIRLKGSSIKLKFYP